MLSKYVRGKIKIEIVLSNTHLCALFPLVAFFAFLTDFFLVLFFAGDAVATAVTAAAAGAATFLCEVLLVFLAWVFFILFEPAAFLVTFLPPLVAFFATFPLAIIIN